jgi:hypothetical protein
MEKGGTEMPTLEQIEKAVNSKTYRVFIGDNDLLITRFDAKTGKFAWVDMTNPDSGECDDDVEDYDTFTPAIYKRVNWRTEKI